MTRFTLAMLAAGLLASTAASAQTFSFESPNANYVTYNPNGYAGVTFSNASGVSVQGAPFFGVAPADGTQAAFIQSSFAGGVGTISFALTGLSAGMLYSTSFFAATRPDYGYSPTTNGPTTPLAVSFNGIGLGSFTATSVNFTQFTAQDFAATAAAGTLTFSGNPLAFGDVNLDLVKITASTATPSVPEPATWGLMLLGFGMIGAACRYVRRSAVAGLV